MHTISYYDKMLLLTWVIKCVHGHLEVYTLEHPYSRAHDLESYHDY